MPRHPLIPTFTPGSRTVLKSGVMNRMRRSVIANANLSVSGDARLHSSATGDHIAVALTGRCWLFELTESVQWPDASRSGGSATEPDVPWADNCKPVYYTPWTGSAKNIYDAQSEPKARTIYWPLTERNAQGIAICYTNFEVGDRTRCVWNRQSGRWESLDWVMGPQKFRWGKLDGTLSSGGTATMSCWRDSTSKLWDGWGEDSGENITVYAPPILSSGSLSSGTWVYAERKGSKWVVMEAEC